MSVPGDFCRTHKDDGRPDAIRGCSGEGRPTCQAGECMYGAEPCPQCDGFRAEGPDPVCAWCKRKTPK